jgi:hypothetical protein
MAQALADYLDMFIRGQQERCVRVSQVIQADLRELRRPEYRAEVAISPIRN